MKALRMIALPLVLLMCSGLTLAADGLIKVKSNHSVAATADKLEAVLSENGMKIMNRINHAAGAKHGKAHNG